MARIAIVGCGATGSRIARQLAVRGTHELVLIDADLDVAESLGRTLVSQVSWGSSIGDDPTIDVTMLAVDCGQHAALASEALHLGHDVVSVTDRLDDVAELLNMDEGARASGCRILAGAGMMPGLSDVLAKHGAAWFDELHEIHVAKFGTGGPACARQHHRALSGTCFDWRDGWQRRTGGSGRELVWFPEPVEAADCYRARLADPRLLRRSHPDVQRITARVAATRRDRMTMQLPMMRRPHPEGLLGAVRVELRGLIDGVQTEIVLGCAERPAVTAGVVAATAAEALAGSTIPAGSWGLAEVVEPIAFLEAVKNRGLRPEVFVGTGESY